MDVEISTMSSAYTHIYDFIYLFVAVCCLAFVIYVAMLNMSVQWDLLVKFHLSVLCYLRQQWSH